MLSRRPGGVRMLFENTSPAVLRHEQETAMFDRHITHYPESVTPAHAHAASRQRAGRVLQAAKALARKTRPLGKALSAAGLAAVLGLSAQSARAAYPDRPVKVIVPFAAGGFTDVAARVMAQQLSTILGGSFVVENKAGAGSTIGTDYVAKSAPDGYTLAVISSNHVTSHLLYKDLTYDPLKSFTPIALLADSPYVLFVNANVPVNNVQELIEYTKKSPTPVHYGTSGNGSAQHLMTAHFITKSGAKLVHVPYKGSAQAMQDLAAGFVDVSFAAVSNGLPHVRTKKLKALAVTSKERSAQLPDVPSLDEAGVKDYNAVVWLALVGPAGMPKDIVDTLNSAVRKGLSSPEAVSALANAGVDVRLSSPEELGRYLEEESKVWGEVVRSSDFKLE